MKTPCDESLVRLVADALSSTDLVDDDFRRSCQSLVGALLYCGTNMRPDFSTFSVGFLCRAMSCPTEALYADALRVLYYLERTKDLGLTYEADSTALHGMTDWAVKHSNSGFVFMLNKAANSWGSKKQTSIALSSCEAGRVDGGLGGGQGGRLLQAVPGGARLHQPPPDRARHGQPSGHRDRLQPRVAHTKTKHIKLSHFFIRELVDEQRISVPFVKTVELRTGRTSSPRP